MGYRLEISKLEYKACGGKLYGYVHNEEKLESWKWLKEHCYIDGTEYWSYGCSPRIVLDYKQFKEFIDLYKKDYEKEYNVELDTADIEKIEKLINDKNEVLLEWG